jgi:competence protein ComEC
LIDAMRSAIDHRIRGVLSGNHGSIASALITGKRDAISARINDAMYISSLAHVLSISGYHMAVVAGLVFFMIRAGFALAASVANRYPIKKWAAIGALLAASFYLVLSGAEVATQRSFIMIAVVLVGVLCDRPALTFRTLAIAAFVVLLLAPEAVVHPSFQMSFAATLALVAAYHRSVMWQPGYDSPVSARIALWGGREIAGLILASLVAGLAITPYAAFHFHRLAPYGVIANLLAMPVVSAWVMPMGILGVLIMPFGFDGPFWRMMGQGIDWMMSVALWVAELPGAVGRIHAFGPGPLLLATAGLLLICLFRSRLRWSGAVLAGIAVLWAAATPKPDMFIAPDGQAAAIRGVDGRLAVLHSGRDTFAVREWLAADGDPRTPGDASLKTGTRCDEIGCIGPLPAGGMAAFSLSIDGLADDCSRSTIVISRREVPGECAAVLLDRKVWRSTGSLALRWNGAGYDIQPARPAGYDRPWSVARPDASTATSVMPVKIRPTVRHATPAASDLDADD